MLVFGSGKSGIGAAELLAKVGRNLSFYDGNKDVDKETVIKKFQIVTILKYMQENFRKKCRRDWIWQC